MRDSVESDYYRVGDWQDIIQLDARDVKVRYRADGHTGLLMLHCHVLHHEDRGTVAQELVVDENDGCTCNKFRIDEDGNLTEISGSPSIGLLPLIGVIVSAATIMIGWQ